MEIVTLHVDSNWGQDWIQGLWCRVAAALLFGSSLHCMSNEVTWHKHILNLDAYLIKSSPWAVEVSKWDEVLTVKLWVQSLMPLYNLVSLWQHHVVVIAPSNQRGQKYSCSPPCKSFPVTYLRLDLKSSHCCCPTAGAESIPRSEVKESRMGHPVVWNKVHRSCSFILAFRWWTQTTDVLFFYISPF